MAGGAQPLANEDGTIWVTYNGELYNELELRRELEAKGHRYRTGSDTESLVHLYEEEGPDFVRRLNGMFALAIWDSRRGRLVLARDRMGQKPLFYYEGLAGGGLVFGSEPKAILAHPDVPRELDRAGLARYLFYEYVPAPHSIWRSVRKLPRAHVLVWEAGESRLTRYWEPPPVDPSERDFESASGRFWDAFRASVARHRRSDVPLGVFLSGGVDSSSVAAALCEVEPPGRVRTFSIGFEDPSFDESRHARAVADHLGTDHRERTFSIASAYELLPEVAGWLDEPFGDASILPTHLLSRFAREEVTVVLGGDGADELLAGYPTFAAERAAGLFRRLPRRAQAMAGTAVGWMPVDHRNFSLDFKLKQFLRGAAEPLPLAHQRWLGSFSGSEIDGLLVDGDPIGVEAEHLRRALSADGGTDPLSRSLALYQDTYLPEDILTKVDRASMACGLEVRAPFLDAELVELDADPAALVQADPQPDQAAAQAGGGASAAGGDPASAQERVRHPGRELAAWSAVADGRRPARRGAAGATGDLPGGGGRPAGRRASRRPPRPPQAALDAADVPALARSLARALNRPPEPGPGDRDLARGGDPPSLDWSDRAIRPAVGAAVGAAARSLARRR